MEHAGVIRPNALMDAVLMAQRALRRRRLHARKRARESLHAATEHVYATRPNALAGALTAIPAINQSLAAIRARPIIAPLMASRVHTHARTQLPALKALSVLIHIV